MTCQECQELLSAYLDRELKGPAALSVRAHLSECPDCAQDAEEILRTVRIMVQALAEARTPEPPLRLKALEPRPRWRAAAWASAAFLIASVWAGSAWTAGRREPRPAPIHAEVSPAPTDPMAGYAAAAASFSRR